MEATAVRHNIRAEIDPFIIRLSDYLTAHPEAEPPALDEMLAFTMGFGPEALKS